MLRFVVIYTMLTTDCNKGIDKTKEEGVVLQDYFVCKIQVFLVVKTLTIVMPNRLQAAPRARYRRFGVSFPPHMERKKLN